MANKVTTIHVPAETLEILDAWAERIDRSRNWIINEAIDAAIADEEVIEKHHPELKKAGKK